MAATFFIAGLASDERYAAAERIGDILSSTLPSVTVHKMMKRDDEWDDAVKHVQEVIGSSIPSRVSPIVWTLEGRLVGSLEEFEEFTRDVYGIECDLPVHYLSLVVEANVRAAKAEVTKAELEEAGGGGPRALVVVNMQNDYFGDGALAVPHAEDIIVVVNSVRKLGFDSVLLRVDHRNGADSDESHPVCVPGTIGADVHPYVDVADGDVTVTSSESIADAVTAAGDAKQVFVVGVPFAGAVRAVATSLVESGRHVVVVTDATSGRDDAESLEAQEAMKAAGVRFVPSDGIPKR